MRDETGVALTELALVLPVLLILLLGIIDFGKAINYWIDETHLANSGARWAVVNFNPGASQATPVSLQAYIKSQADSRELRGEVQGTQNTAHAADVSICFYGASSRTRTSTPAVGDIVKVTVKYDYDWLHYIGSQVFGSSNLVTTTIGSSASMRIEVPPTKYSMADNAGGSAACANTI